MMEALIDWWATVDARQLAIILVIIGACVVTALLYSALCVDNDDDYFQKGGDND